MEPTKVVSIANAPAYTWGGQCTGWHLLRSPALSVIEELMPAGTSESRHYHAGAQQLFYILEGTASFYINEVLREVLANEALHVPAGTVHAVSNNGEVPLRFILVSQPMAHGDRVEVPGT